MLDALSSFSSGSRWRRNSQSSGDSLFGDEELEEGFGLDEDRLSRRNSNEGEARRLSRELEVGFKDDSDEEGNEQGDGRAKDQGREADFTVT